MQLIKDRPLVYWMEAGVYHYLAFHSESAGSAIRFRWGYDMHGHVVALQLADQKMTFVPDHEDLGEIAMWLMMANR